jgi:hypothetical protein
MSNLISAALGVLSSFRDEVAGWTNSGLLKTVEDHIAQIENAAETDVHAGETAVKAVFGELYGALHGHAAVPVVPAAPVVEPAPAPVVEAPAPAEPVAAPVAVDPTPAPSTTAEDSSAPSSTPSTSTEPATAPATPAV